MTKSERPRRRMPVRMSTLPATGALAALLGPDLGGAEALCAGLSPWWDSEVPDEDDEQRSDRLSAATAVCTRCPARAPCLAAGLAQPSSGVWGGELFGRARRRRGGQEE